MIKAKFMRALSLLSVLLLPLFFTAGCTIEEIEAALGLDTPKEARFVLSFHRKVAYPRGNLQSEQLLHFPDGRDMVIETYPLFSSHQIVEIAAKPIPGKPGFYHLFLRPNQKGRMMWMQLTAMSRQEPVYVLLDGIYFADFEADKIGRGNERWVELPYEVDAARALNIVKYANDNFRYFNDGAHEDETPFADL